MTDQQITSLRRIASDAACPSLKRLRALDILAADCDLYRTNETMSQASGVPGNKPRRFVLRALKRLRKSARLKPKHRSLIESRLLFISGVSVSDDLYGTPGASASASSEGDELRRLLAEYGTTPKQKEETCR